MVRRQITQPIFRKITQRIHDLRQQEIGYKTDRAETLLNIRGNQSWRVWALTAARRVLNYELYFGD